MQSSNTSSNMKKTDRTIGGVLALFVGAGLIYTSFRIARLEDRIEAIQQAIQHPSNQPVRYAFDPSFIDYFGERGVEEVLRAVRVQESTQLSNSAQALE